MLRSLISTKRRRLLTISVGVMAVPALALAWWLGSPLFLNVTVEEEFPFAATAELPSGVTMEEANMTMETLSRLPDTGPAEDITPDMATARVLRSGMFRDADRFHKGSGAATVYTPDRGDAVLRLEDFRVTNGPQLHVLLSAHPDPANSTQLKDDGYIDLGALKGNIGNQNYPLPSGHDPSQYHSVIIYCKPFHVIFAVAPLG